MTPATRRSRVVSASARRPLILLVLAITPLCVLLSACGTAAVAAASPAAAPLKVIAEPQAGVTPFLQMIDGAHASVDLTMYELLDRHVEHALARDAGRGVDVVSLGRPPFLHHLRDR